MTFSNQFKGRERPISDLFTETFTASEGAEEGAIIGNLASKLLKGTAQSDIHVFTAEDKAELKGGAIFTRLTYANDSRIVFILGPMAVATTHQGQGIGRHYCPMRWRSCVKLESMWRLPMVIQHSMERLGSNPFPNQLPPRHYPSRNLRVGSGNRLPAKR